MAGEKGGTHPLWLMVAGAYAGSVAAAILLGTLTSLESSERHPGNAVDMPAASVLIALTLGGAAFGLFLKKNFGRFVFLVMAPWGSIALGSAFAPSLWREDVPYTAVAIFAYVPLAFLLARGSSLRATCAPGGNWVSRGGALVLACAVAMLLARVVVGASKPSGGGSFYGVMVGLNEYVKRLVLCDVPLWNYIVALIAVSIPTRFAPGHGTPQGGVPNGGPTASGADQGTPEKPPATR